jgi:hypothetical protein
VFVPYGENRGGLLAFDLEPRHIARVAERHGPSETGIVRVDREASEGNQFEHVSPLAKSFPTLAGQLRDPVLVKIDKDESKSARASPV